MIEYSINYFKQTPKFQIFLDVVTLGGAVIGSALLAANIPESKYGYVFFLLSAGASIKLVLNSNISKSVLFTQLYFVVIDIFGIWRWFV